jgi:hypothetical protein
VNWVSIEPSAVHKRVEHGCLIGPVVDRKCNILVREFADVAPRCFPRRQMPKAFKESNRLARRNIEAPAEPFHLAVSNGFAFHAIWAQLRDAGRY